MSPEGEPRITFQRLWYLLTGAQPPTMSTPMYAVGNPAMQAASMSGLTGPEIVFSGKHNGICIYFSRIMG